ncbi:VOC family protein [Pseudorhodoferax sp. LjRoot39]|uniref:VOC family protein n=1 Tax=Pseudorhodoferax sp. LjRoot39 TaxID=3342328 RepID=UPI003ECF6780
MMIQRMDHFTLVTDALQETIAFYGRLGFSEGPRPGFSVPGAWLYLNGQAVLHVIERDAMPQPRRGVLDHMAYAGEGLGGFLALLGQHGIAHKLIRAPAPFRTWQVFFEDPNGCEVEVDFDAGEPRPGAAPP